MRLNMECVRDILLCVEKNTGLHKSCYFIDEEQMESVCYAMGEDTEPVPRYQSEMKHDGEVVFYHVTYCIEAGLLKKECGTAEYKTTIAGLTVEGHALLENIREDKNWKATKQYIKAAGAFSLEVLKKAAEVVVLKRLGMMG